jgi:hypothetical protein
VIRSESDAQRLSFGENELIIRFPCGMRILDFVGGTD